MIAEREHWVLCGLRKSLAEEMPVHIARFEAMQIFKAYLTATEEQKATLEKELSEDLAKMTTKERVK